MYLSPKGCFLKLLIVHVKQEPWAPSSLSDSYLQMFYGGDLNLRTLPFFPLVKDFDVINSLTCVPVICLQLHSSAFNKVA